MAVLDTYLVGTDGPWTDREAAHLWRRAAFGAIPAQRAAAVGVGDQAAFEAAVDALVDIAAADPYLDQPAGTGTGVVGDPLADLPDDTSDLGNLKNPTALRHLQAHWIYRMRYSSQPLQEQLCLFLHDHMVSDYPKIFDDIDDKVNAGNDGSQGGQSCTTGTLAPDSGRQKRLALDLLDIQNDLFRGTGIDHFRDLLINITRDPAMLLYLDNKKNKAGRPQENYSREVMELFSMGVGNYNENDVGAIAACLTGERLPWSGCSNDYQFDLYGFEAAKHEPGNKVVFGTTVFEDMTGKETEDVVDLILAKVSVAPDVSGLAPPYNNLPATAIYLSWKLLTWFVSHDIQLSPVPDTAVLELADYMRGDDAGVYPQRRYPYDMRAVLRKLFISKYFYDTANFYTMIKNPADFVVCALRSLDLWEDFNTSSGPANRMGAMGMALYEAPNVAGWDHGAAWISSVSLIERYNYANRIGQEILTTTEGDAWVDGLLAVNGGSFTDANDHTGMLAYFVPRLIQDTLTPAEESELLSFLGTFPQGYRKKIRGLIHVMMAMPKYQLK
jgi:hypothetical protein